MSVRAVALVGVIGVALAAYTGYRVGAGLTRAAFLQKENAELLSSAVQVSELQKRNRALQDAYNQDLDAVRDFERRTERVRDKARRDTAIANARVEALREYAAGAADVAESCIDEYRGMAAEAARASAAAHALN